SFDAFDVPYAVAIEPASVKKRSILGLGNAFKSTEKALSGYVDANELPAFKAARKESVGPLNYVLGLGRLSNLAISKGLSGDGFMVRTAEALGAQSDMVATIAWGSESELAEPELL